MTKEEFINEHKLVLKPTEYYWYNLPTNPTGMSCVGFKKWTTILPIKCSFDKVYEVATYDGKLFLTKLVLDGFKLLGSINTCYFFIKEDFEVYVIPSLM